MKKLIVAAILTVASCGTAPVTAGYDADLCEWSMSADQSEVETQIRADVQNIIKRDNIPAAKAAEAITVIADEGAAIQYNWVLYCDNNFNNTDIVKEIVGE
jgi:hypothetical protein